MTVGWLASVTIGKVARVVLIEALFCLSGLGQTTELSEP